MSGPRLLLYGATGNSGARLAEALAPLGDRLLLGGRDGDALHALGNRLGLSVRRFGLEDPALLGRALDGADVVLNAAGPYAATALPLARACITTGTDYLDLSGEWPSFEALLALDEPARARGVMLLPGVAVAILVSDCLLAAAARLFPRVAALRLGLSRPHILGRGSIRTMFGLADTHALVRVNGQLERVSAHRHIRDFDFGAGPVRASAFSWPDVITVERSTGVGSFAAFVETATVERAT
ncbi:MAG: saccharopine dehydrogenase NADP-binding domain-containing protein, partial [Thermaurantiacus sp.]